MESEIANQGVGAQMVFALERRGEDRHLLGGGQKGQGPSDGTTDLRAAVPGDRGPPPGLLDTLGRRDGGQLAYIEEGTVKAVDAERGLAVGPSDDHEIGESAEAS